MLAKGVQVQVLSWAQKSEFRFAFFVCIPILYYNFGTADISGGVKGQPTYRVELISYQTEK